MIGGGQQQPELPPAAPQCTGQSNATIPIDNTCSAWPDGRSFSLQCQSYNASQVVKWETKNGGCGDSNAQTTSTVYVVLNQCQRPVIGMDNSHEGTQSPPPQQGGSGRRLDGGSPDQGDKSPIAPYYKQYKDNQIQQAQPDLLTANSSFVFAVVTNGTAYNLTAAFWAGTTTCQGTPVKFFTVPLAYNDPNHPQQGAQRCEGQDAAQHSDVRRALQTSTTSNSYTLLGNPAAVAIPASVLTQGSGAAGMQNAVFAAVFAVVAMLLV